MSDSAWGGFILDNDYSLCEKNDIAFQIIEIGARQKIGIDIDWRVRNINLASYKKYENSPNSLFYAFTGSALSPNVEPLFGADGWEHYAGRREDFGESLESRMTRVQMFFERILELSFIQQVMLHINAGPYDDYQAIDIKANQFKKIMIDLYNQPNAFIPVVRLVIT